MKSTSKRRLLAIVVILGIILSLAACGKEKTNTNGLDTEISSGTSETIPTQNIVKEISLVEMQSTGEISYDKYLTTLSPEHSMDYYSHISPEWFPFTYKGTCGYADANGKVMIRNTYTKASYFTENKAVVQTSDKIWHIIDTSGNVLLDFPSDIDFTYTGQLVFKNGCLVAAQRYQSPKEMRMKIISVDSSLTVSVKDVSLGQYGTNEFYSTCVYAVNTDEFKGIITYYQAGNQNFGAKVYDINGNLVYTYSPEALKLTDQAVSGLALDKPEEIIEKLLFINDGYINVVNESGLWGIMDINTKEMLIDYKYDYIGKYADDLIVACSYGKWGCVNKNDEIKVEFQYAYIDSFNNGNAFAKKDDGSLCIIDTTGKTLAKYSDSNALIGSSGALYRVCAFTDSGVTIVCPKDNATDRYVITNTGKVLGRFEKVRYLSENYLVANDTLYRIVVADQSA